MHHACGHDSYHVVVPRPRGRPLARPLAPLVDVVRRLVDVPRAAGSRDCRASGLVFFVPGFAETGGFSTKEVSVVLRLVSARFLMDLGIACSSILWNSAYIKVASVSGASDRVPGAGDGSASRSRRNDSGIGPLASVSFCHYKCTSSLESGLVMTSGKSTQKAFIFNPYRKLEKDSVKRERLSCMSWKCIMLASRSAMASDSSAKAGSNALSGNDASVPPALRAESRNDEREEGRRGVVGREVRDLELERLSADRGV